MTDTDPKADAVRLQLLRAMSPQKRLALATGWSTSLRRMSVAAIRREFPGLNDRQVRRIFAERWLGPDLAAEAYPDSAANG